MESKVPLPNRPDSRCPFEHVPRDGATRTGPSQDFLERTREVWEPIAGAKLTREDARQMVENISRFFDILLEWDDATSLDEHPASGETDSTPHTRSSPE